MLVQTPTSAGPLGTGRRNDHSLYVSELRDARVRRHSLGRMSMHPPNGALDPYLTFSFAVWHPL